jgi:hypothetical protein
MNRKESLIALIGVFFLTSPLSSCSSDAVIEAPEPYNLVGTPQDVVEIPIYPGEGDVLMEPYVGEGNVEFG